MAQQTGGPVEGRSRISQLDIIRGFALFGVLWMNLFEHGDFVIPADKVIQLAPKAVETVIQFLSVWLMIGKAQALFSMLFGFGFALFLERAEAAGANGTRLYLRRLSFLLLLGVAHGLLLWPGDILNSYALMGFLLAAGLAMALIPPVIQFTGYTPQQPLKFLLQVAAHGSQVLLALGYAAGLVVLCQSPRWQQRLSGLGAVGQMALTNYLTQSVFYFFVLYGFGFGLLPYVGPAFCLLVAVALFAVQIVFSRWWLARYRFGPMEWVWRSFTYGARQPMRKIPPVMEAMTA